MNSITHHARVAPKSDEGGLRITSHILVTGGGADVLTAAIPKQPAAVEEAIAAAATL